MGVAGVARGPQRLEVERLHPRRMRTVHDRLDASLAQLADESLDREHQGRGARDMAHDRDARPVGHPFQDRPDHLIGRRRRERHRRDDDASAGRFGDDLRRVQAGVVLVVGGEELVARPQLPRAQGGVDASRRIREEREVLRPRAQERAERCTDIVEQALEPVAQEPDRLTLQLLAPRMLGIQHRPRRRAVRAVVEERDRGVELPVGGEWRRHAPMMRQARVPCDHRGMCGRMTQQTDTSEIARIFGAEVADADPGERYNVAPTQPVSVVLERDSRRVVESHRWGLVPAWAASPAAGNRMINARAETVERTPAFRVAFLRRRCIVPADGFYEWRRVGKQRQAYLIRHEDRSPLAFAGLWSLWPDPATGEWLRSCSVITTEANDLIATLHDRMPVILDPEDWSTWLDPRRPDQADLRAMLHPAPSVGLELVPVSSRVNSPNNEGPELIERVEPTVMAAAEPEQVQTTLFG